MGKAKDSLLRIGRVVLDHRLSILLHSRVAQERPRKVVLLHSHALARHYREASSSSSSKHAHPHRARHSNSIPRTARVFRVKITARTVTGTGTARQTQAREQTYIARAAGNCTQASESADFSCSFGERQSGQCGE